MCATMGHATVPIVQKLRIGIISTGDELKPPGQDLSYGEIYESNSFGLAGLVKMLGHVPVRYEAVHDSMDALRDQCGSRGLGDVYKRQGVRKVPFLSPSAFSAMFSPHFRMKWGLEGC